MHTYIKAVGSYVPPRMVSNDDLAHQVDTNDEWIFSHTGIKNRHISEKDVATSDLAVSAIKRLIDNSEMNVSDIDAIIVATATSDYIGFPSTACVIQDKLALDKILAFDLAAGCTGFIYALEIADALMNRGDLNNVAVIGVEKLSAVTDWTDRNTCVLFGDGAGVVILSKSEEDRGGIIDSVLHAQGSGASYLSIPSGGTADRDGDEKFLHMDGRAVYNFAVRVVKDTILELLERNNLTFDDIDWIVPHQANSRIIQAAAKRLKVEESKFFMNIENYANTSAASIPIALDDMNQQNLLKRGMKIITVGFGAGLTYGGNLIQW
ncbi:MAG: ketoacyl-ACP synthase III [Spirochaetia bacterium]|nr:ketoacyl-ACP synthase III [Spirochaetia bacterium]